MQAILEQSRFLGPSVCDASGHLSYPGAFGHGLGHAVGLLIHEPPRFSPAFADELKPGHVMTVEPGVYIPGLGGCRIEDTIIITSDGYINTIAAPKHLIEL